jgi:biopolymer transport protein TolR
MRARRRGDRMGVNGEINVVSLIDVMMLLMVIFMITAPIMQGGVDVSLPKANVQPLEPKGGLVVSIRSNGDIYVDDAEISFAEFENTIKLLAEKKGRDGVYVRADKATPYGNVVRVLAAMRANGVTDMGLVAEPEDRR